LNAAVEKEVQMPVRNSGAVLAMRDSGGRRLGGDRRRFSYSVCIPERRPGPDRRAGLDRRDGLDRRSGKERRSGIERRSGEHVSRDLEMRSGKDRRNSRDRRSGIERRFAFG